MRRAPGGRPASGPPHTGASRGAGSGGTPRRSRPGPCSQDGPTAGPLREAGRHDRRPNAPRGLRQDEGASSVGASGVQGCVMRAGHCRRCQPSPPLSRAHGSGAHTCREGRADGRVRLGHALSPGFQHVPPKCPPCLCPLRGREIARGASRRAGEGTSCQVRRGGKDRDTPRDSGRPAQRPNDGETHGQTRDGRRLFPARATRPKHVPHSSIIPSARLSFPGFLITRRDRLFSGSCDHA